MSLVFERPPALWSTHAPATSNGESEPRAINDFAVDLLFFDAGGGHRASATALKAVAQQQQLGWRIRMVNLREVLDPVDSLRKYTGIKVEEFYNRLLRHGLTAGSAAMLRLTQQLIKRLHVPVVEKLTEFWRESPAQLVVSLIPNFNRALLEGLRGAEAGRPPAPFVTILTDLADCPPHFWIEPYRPGAEQYFICGTERARQQALALGHSSDCVLRSSGMIVRPEFYAPRPLDRAGELRRLGFDPRLATGLVMFGGYGSRQMVTIARAITAAGLKTQLIFICGHNAAVRQSLTRMQLPAAHHVEGFCNELPRFMALADFFIGKPGPGSISEALVSGLPVVLERNVWTMIQERYNTQWVASQQLGIVLPSFSAVAGAIAELCRPEVMTRTRARVQNLRNRAVFEIPEMLSAIATGTLTARGAGQASA